MSKLAFNWICICGYTNRTEAESSSEDIDHLECPECGKVGEWLSLAGVMTGRIDAKKATESNKPKAKEAVDHPDHYNFGPIECVDYIISCGYGKGFCIGNALKYLARAERKKNPAEDLEKAKWYSEYARMIMVAEAGNAKTKEELHILSLLPKKENR